MHNPFATFIAFLSLVTAALRQRMADASAELATLVGPELLGGALYKGAMDKHESYSTTARWALEDYRYADCWAEMEHEANQARFDAMMRCYCGSTDIHPELGECAECLEEYAVQLDDYTAAQALDQAAYKLGGQPKLVDLAEWHDAELRKYIAAGCPTRPGDRPWFSADIGLEGPPLRTLYYDGRY